MKSIAILTAILLFACCALAEDTLDARLKNATPDARELMLVWDKKAERPVDARHLPARTLLQGSGFKPPESLDDWKGRARYLREQVLIAAGLWPLTEKSDRCALEADIHGKVDRPGYTIEKVFFQSYPGFYVSGLLYRPTGKAGPFPGVLCPHGHWPVGRFTETSDKEVERQIKGGWEKEPMAAKYIQQARCANLAMLGCVVFQYDMVGYADADPARFPHRKTWLGAEAEMNGLGILGLQLWDSMRSLDFLESLPEVDKTRLACTGESGGATQTFLMMATDDRLAVAAPVCMISAGNHQGGCVCENTALLRVGTDNVEIAATFAPKPFIHPSATGDWTKDFMELGFPQIKAVYKLFKAEENVEAMRQKADHNYNLASREAVYNFFNKHLKLNQPTPVVEARFEGLKPPAEMTVFDEKHPRPSTSADAEQLKKYLEETSAKRIAALMPKDIDGLKKYREIFGPALAHMTSTQLPTGGIKGLKPLAERNRGTFKAITGFASRNGDAEKIPCTLYLPNNAPDNGEATILVSPEGKAGLVNNDGSLREPLAALLAKKHAVIAIDVFGIGENTAALAGQKRHDAGTDFFATYNRTVLANRVHDILTIVAQLSEDKEAHKFNLAGLGETGTACLLAAALSNGAIARVAVDADKFDFDQVKSYDDPRFLPSARRFGGLWPISAMIAPTELFVFNTGQKEISPWLRAAYKAAGAEGKLKFAEAADAKAIVDWLTR